MTHARRCAHAFHMTQHMAVGTVPELTLGWRLKMALEAGNVSALAMAEHLGVTRQTISRWMGDKGKPPNRAYLMQWALQTGVPFEWILTGKVVSGSGGSDGGTRSTPGYAWDPGRQVAALFHRKVHDASECVDGPLAAPHTWATAA